MNPPNPPNPRPQQRPDQQGSPNVRFDFSARLPSSNTGNQMTTIMEQLRMLQNQNTQLHQQTLFQGRLTHTDLGRRLELLEQRYQEISGRLERLERLLEGATLVLPPEPQPE
ncbi:hypothetical protein MMC22_006369 [Lobaria immixta]|nr:hypothetical protein [Lobaria immixta]